MVGEDLYQSLFMLDKKRQQLDRQLDEIESRQAAAAANDGARERQRLLRQEVGPDEIAEVVSAGPASP